jgi:hypothetical protein
MLDIARQYSVGKYRNLFVAPIYQKMVRAEAGALPDGDTPAIMAGQVALVYRTMGQCACVTCGKVGPWKGDYIGGGEIETGHFEPSRANSIIFEESNAHPQCKHCNQHRGGNLSAYRIWMEHVYGKDEVDRLERLKNVVVQFNHEQLVDMRVAFQARLTLAEASLAK